MCLTGVIALAELQLHRVHIPWRDTEMLPLGCLDELFAISNESEEGWENTAAWIDCLTGFAGGLRGIFSHANPSATTQGPMSDAQERRI